MISNIIKSQQSYLLGWDWLTEWNKSTENSHIHNITHPLPSKHLGQDWQFEPGLAECKAASVQQKYSWNPNGNENIPRSISEVDWVIRMWISDRRLNLKPMPTLKMNRLLPDMVIHICKCSWQFAHLILGALLLLLLKGKGEKSCLRLK